MPAPRPAPGRHDAWAATASAPSRAHIIGCRHHDGVFRAGYAMATGMGGHLPDRPSTARPCRARTLPAPAAVRARSGDAAAPVTHLGSLP